MNAIVPTQLLTNGDPSGIIKTTLDNWSGAVFKTPRKLIKEINKIELLIENPCYYILVCLLTNIIQ